MARGWLVVGCASAFVAVAAGAFGAHALKQRLAADLLAVFETAVRYQMFHALALLAAGLLSQRSPSGAADAAGWLFAAGTLVFCGSLYVLALSGVRAWGAVTPLGGAAFLAGWIALAYASLR